MIGTGLLPAVHPLLLEILWVDPRLGCGPLNGAALGVIEQLDRPISRVVRVYADPREVIVLFVNQHGEGRTAFLSTNRTDESLVVHVSQGFK